MTKTWKQKICYEVRVFNVIGKLTSEEQKQLEKEMKKQGFTLEDVVEMKDFDEKGQNYTDYRFARY